MKITIHKCLKTTTVRPDFQNCLSIYIEKYIIKIVTLKFRIFKLQIKGCMKPKLLRKLPNSKNSKFNILLKNFQNLLKF